MSSLKGKTFAGVTWSFADNLIGSGISFIISIILARMLNPSVYGLIGMVTIFFSFANIFVDSGFSAGLIRKVHCDDIEYNTVLIFNVTVSLFLYSILFLSAPFIANFFKEYQLIKIIRVLSLVIIFDSFSIVQRTKLIREINFKVQTKISFFSSLTSGFIGIGFAYFGFGVWSLVFQILSRQLLTSILLWIFSSWLPTFEFSKQSFQELFKFGSKLLGSGLISTLQNNIYYLIIGKFFSAISLGYYTRAEQFNAIVTNNITGTLERVFFPVLSTIQEDTNRFKAVLKRMVRTSFFVTYFSLMTLSIIAKPLIGLLLGDKWIPAIPLLQLLCMGSIFFPLNAVNLNILKIKGRSDLIFKLQLIKTLLMFVVVVSGILWGINIMLLIRILTSIIATYLNSKYSGLLADFSIKEQISDIFPYFFSESLVLSIMFILGFLPFSNIICLIIQLTVGISLIILIFEKIKFSEYLDIKSLLVKSFVKGDRI